MKRALVFSFTVLGITSLVGQVLFLRELMIVFYGNEFFIGWILFGWLFWVGIGSLAAGRLMRSSPWSARWLIACHVAITLLLPVGIFLARFSRVIVGTVPGQIPDLLPSLAYSFFTLAPLSILLGAQFIVAARAWGSLGNAPKTSRILGEGYVFETLGFVIGGILFGYFLVTANEFRVISAVAWLNVIAAAAIYALPPNRTWAIRIILVTVSVLTAIVFLLARPLNWRTAQFRFPGQCLVDSRNSIYGNLAVTETGRQFNFFENGLFLAADRDEMANEYAVHFPMLAHPNPKNILLIGNGFNGALVELLKHAPDRIDYVELDPDLIRMTRAYIPDELDLAFSDPRVHVVFEDGRFFIKQKAAGGKPAYDVIIVNLPNPGTVLINRFYTKEFFAGARSLLKPDGVFSTRLAFSPDYLGRELENLGASVYQSLHAVFSHVILLPEYEIFYIASQQRPAILKERLGQRGIKTRFATAQYIDYRLTTDRIPQVMKAFRENTSARINRDEQPAACFYNLTYWISSFHPRIAKAMTAAGQTGWKWMAVVVAMMTLPFLAVRRTRSGRIPALAMGVGSFTLMACEVVIILAFQVFCGYLYYRLSLIIAGLMLGMAMGTWAATHVLERNHRYSLPIIHAAILLYCAFFIFISKFLAATPAEWSAAIELVFLLLAALIGALVGFEYPIANRLYLEQRGEQENRAGVIYGVDLLGSCFGALLAGVWMLPVLGITGTMVVLIVMNFVIMAVAGGRTSTSAVTGFGGGGTPPSMNY